MRTRRTARLLVVSLLALAACGDDGAPPPPDSGTRDTGAGPDASSPCGAPGATLDGWPCRCDEDCMPGAICRLEEVIGEPGGFCLRACEMPSVTCSSGAACWADVGPYCYPECTTNADCPPARVCGFDGFCLPRCQADSDCLSGHCDPWRAECTDGTPSTGAGLFADCTAHEQCRSGFCSSHGCITSCSIERNGCPDGAVCFGEVSSDSGFCAMRCTRDEDCMDPRLSCIDFERPLDTGVCVPMSIVGG